MGTRFKFENPGEIEGTLTKTMKMKDWEALRDQLNNVWPASDLVREINDMLAQARKIIWPEAK